jgi:hypothetical protein
MGVQESGEVQKEILILTYRFHAWNLILGVMTIISMMFLYSFYISLY